MAKIYREFQELIHENKSIFRFFNREKNQGIYQAIWDARQAEVDALKAELANKEEKIQKLSSQNRSLSMDVLDFDTVKVQLKSQLVELQMRFDELDLERSIEIEKLQNEIQSLLEELDKKRSLIKSLEFMHKSDDIQKNKAQKESRNLEDLNRDLSVQLDYQKEVVERLSNEIENKNMQIAQMSIELEEAQKYSKQYRNINNKMTLEMDKMTREVQALRMALN